MPWSVKPCRSGHHTVPPISWFRMHRPLRVLWGFPHVLLNYPHVFASANLLSDAGIVSWGEQYKMVDLPVLRMDVQEALGLSLFERAPSPTSDLGILGAWKKPGERKTPHWGPAQKPIKLYQIKEKGMEETHMLPLSLISKCETVEVKHRVTSLNKVTVGNESTSCVWVI